jgi:hypothetical protein
MNITFTVVCGEEICYAAHVLYFIVAYVIK